MDLDCRLFPARLSFPPAVRDVGSLVGDEQMVRLTADAVGFERLPDHAAMRSLWCFGVDERRLAVLSECDALEALYIEQVSVRDLGPLAALRRLEVLGVDGATKVTSLDWLERVSPLSQLRLQHLPRVDSLEGIVSQSGLRALDVSGSMWTKMKVDSFEPLSHLVDLRLLYLTSIVSRDGSLQPLAGLKQLRELNIAGLYDWQEFAKLAGRRSDVSCSWFQPFIDFEQQVCDECRSSMVMLTGRRQPILCPRCDADRVQKHVDRFMQLERETATALPG